MAREPMGVPAGKPREARAGEPVHQVMTEDWFAAAPPEPAVLEPGASELAPPGPATRQGRVDIPAEP
jgi:hypothetical protein